MFKICPLFSGSDGNSTYVEHDGMAFLVDIGRSCRQTEIAIKENGFDPKNIQFIFVTHEHSDHIKGLRVFAKKFGVKVYASEGTISELENKKLLDGKIKYETLKKEGINIEGMNVIPFEISHDCAQGYGYSFMLDDKNLKISFCSDSGIISNKAFESILGSSLVFMESNHDIEMLKNGPYPWFLKDRILSDIGHLSNAACSEIINKLVRNGTRKFVLCHLSTTNNTPEIAYNLALETLNHSGVNDFELYVAPKENLGKISIKI